jgi:hypothetical protein
VGDGSPVASGGQEVEECKGGRCCTILPGQAVVGKENGEGGRGARAAIFCPAGREKESGGVRCYIYGEEGRWGGGGLDARCVEGDRQLRARDGGGNDQAEHGQGRELANVWAHGHSTGWW